MDQDDIVDKLVSENRADPRNKILIDGADLISFATQELGSPVEDEVLKRTLQAYNSGELTEQTQNILDAATALCHQVADRVWGKCIDEDEDEWEEIDIKTAWHLGEEEGECVVMVEVRRM